MRQFMRAIFVNHCHPDCPHVCGTRAREFANALARQGHQIVLLTETLRRTDPAPDLASLAGALAAHDWRQPFRLACPPRRAPVLEALRAGKLPILLSKLVVLYQYLAHGGMFTDWRAGTRPYWPVLAESFRPDVVWGVFGNTDAWAIAQGLARQSGCPWIRDIKDQWTQFIPSLVRSALARRFADAAGTTALSRANAEDVAPWMPGTVTIAYSGIDANLLKTHIPPPSGSLWTMVLSGGIYSPASLTVLVEGIGRFLDGEVRGPARLVYVGAGADTVRSALRVLDGRIAIDVKRQIPFSEYWALVSNADVNLYVRAPGTGAWHHKIVELLAAQRPILCLPEEIEEARSLAAAVGGRLYSCATAGSVAKALADVWSMRNDPAHDDGGPRLQALSWDAQTTNLLGGFAAAGIDAGSGAAKTVGAYAPISR